MDDDDFPGQPNTDLIDLAGSMLITSIEEARDSGISHASLVWVHLNVALNIILHCAPRGREMDVLHGAGEVFKRMVEGGEEALRLINEAREHHDKLQRAMHHEPGHA